MRAHTCLAVLSLAVLLTNCNGAKPGSGPGAASPSAGVPSTALFRLPVTKKLSGPPPVPMSLTASDGSGLRLTRLVARAVVEAPLAFTELKLTFQNPQDRVVEGQFAITLPPGATISRFAMKIGDGWQEGEMVELQAAREAYEDFLHRRQDPALLEQGAGNEFTARVFPIPARGVKELIVSYSQELDGTEPYAIPVRGLPEMSLLDATINVPGVAAPVLELKQANFQPTTDVVLAPQHFMRHAGLRNGNLVVARVKPVAESHPDPIASAVVLVDTSASRALGWEEQVRLLEQLVAKLVQTSGPKTPLSVACFDQTTEAIFQGEAGSFGPKEIARIQERQAFGASNLEQALSFAATQAKTHGMKRVVLISDGVVTAGVSEKDQLTAATLRLKTAGVERLDVVSVGGIRDDALLHQLVTVGLARDGIVVAGTTDMATIGRRLAESTRSDIDVKIEGASWSWPKKLDGVQAGDEVLVYADLPSKGPVKISVGGGPAASRELDDVERPLLERAWAKAKIASLLSRESKEGRSPELQKQIIALSVQNRVMSPYTAMLVLETERDYARFKIDRRALSDVLTVDSGRVAVRKRPPPTGSDLVIAAADPAARDRMERERRKRPADGAPPARSGADPRGGNDPMSAQGNMWGDAVGDSFGAGGLGLSGVGEGGGGRGEGIGLGNVGSLGHGAGTRGGSAPWDSRPSGPVGARPSPEPPPPPPAPPPREERPVVQGRPMPASTPPASAATSSGQGMGSGQGRLGGSHAVAPVTVRQGATQVSGRLPPEVIQRIVRQNFGRLRLCYENGLRQHPGLSGRVSVRFVIGTDGSVTQATDGGSQMADPNVVGCVVRAFHNLSFPQPEGGVVTVVFPIVFGTGDEVARDERNRPRDIDLDDPPPQPPLRNEEENDRFSKDGRKNPYTGQFKTVMSSLEHGDIKGAITTAYGWHSESPGDVMALVALGEAFEAAGELPSAARTYGSIVDLFSSRADLRRFAGSRLERIRDNAGLDLAIDTYAKAEAQRPDHPASHRLLAFALLKKGDYEKAFAAGLAGVLQRYPQGRFRGVDRILQEDLGLLGAAWIKADPKRAEDITRRVIDGGGTIEDAPSLRFVLNWETDANDVDFHIFDAEGNHAFYSQPALETGGELYADVTTGYGPECFTIRGPKDHRSASYKLQAHYYSRGPMGYGMGKVEVIDHDGKGGITFEQRPFVAMVDQAFVDLGTVRR